MRLLGWGMLLMLLLTLPSACGGTPGQTNNPTPGVTPTGPNPTPTPTRLPTPEKKQVIIAYHPDYLKVYAEEPAANPGRIESILKEIQGLPDFVFVEPEPATEKDLSSVHTPDYIEDVRLISADLYNTALLSAGGAILASDAAMAGQAAMAINRPPGHHASPSSRWGFCYFNNVAIAVKKLLDENRIGRALIVDFDLHFGDGTSNIFQYDSRVTYFHVEEGDRVEQLTKLGRFLSQTKGYDILAVSAGFDGGKLDWGQIFEIQDYTTMGTLLKKAAETNCGGKRFAVLEGGYNHSVLGRNVKAFLEGFR